MTRRRAASLLLVAGTLGLWLSPAPARAAEPVETRPELELVGGLTAAQLVTGQAFVEALARGLERDAFTAEEVQQHVMLQLNLLDVLIRQFGVVADDERIVASDRELMEQSISILTSQKRADQRLMDFLDSGERDDLEAFYTASKRVKSQIDRLIGAAIEADNE